MNAPTLPGTLLQAPPGPTDEEILALIIVSYMLLALFLAAAAWLAVWLYRDARHRGHNVAVWLLLSLLGPAFGLASVVALAAPGDPSRGTVLALAFIVVGGLAVLAAWLSVRRPEILFDAHGAPVHPKALATARWMFHAGAPPPSRVPVAPVSVAVASGPVGITGRPILSSGAAPNWTPLARVKCPHCQTVFSYAPAAGGPTRVQCPKCEAAGTI